MFEARTVDYLLLEATPRHLLTRALINKLLRRLRKSVYGNDYKGYERAFIFNGLTVFDDRRYDGGGWMHGQDFLRALLSLRLKRCNRLFEWCAGPGYIGFFLLANGFCDHLVLADINDLALEKARQTVRFNNLENRVTIHVADCLDGLPGDEKWDVVVGNPPQYIPRPNNTFDLGNLRAIDEDWRLHKRFYKSLKPFMQPGGLAVIEENALPQLPGPLARRLGQPAIFGSANTEPRLGCDYIIDLSPLRDVDFSRFPQGSKPDVFRPMVEEGGGRWNGWMPAINVVGVHDGFYYVVSSW